MVHALTAQLFLCVVVGVATLTSPTWPEARLEVSSDDELRRSATLFALVLTQLVVGILVRHFGPAVRPLLGNGLFQTHVALALGVTWLAARQRAAARVNGRKGAAVRASTLLGLLLVQLSLGLATFAVTDTLGYDRQATAAESWIPTLHVAIGAGVLAMAARSLIYSIAGTRFAAVRGQAERIAR
jgi:hypothetical protein